MRDDNDWYRYFGSSTIHSVGRHGYAVHLPRDSKSGEKNRGEDGAAGEDSGGLGSDYERNND